MIYICWYIYRPDHRYKYQFHIKYDNCCFGYRYENIIAPQDISEILNTRWLNKYTKVRFLTDFVSDLNQKQEVVLIAKLL